MDGSGGSRTTSFQVHVALADDGYEVSVTTLGGKQYAKTFGPTLDVALQMAVPYMAYSSEPDPFARLHDRLRARHRGKPGIQIK